MSDFYLKDFDRLIENTGKLANLKETVLDQLGQQLSDQFNTLIATATKAGNADLTDLGNQAMQQLLTLRLNIEHELGRHDRTEGQVVAKSFEQLDAALQTLVGSTKEAAYQDTLRALHEGTAAYREAFGQCVMLDGGNANLISGPMANIGEKVQDDADAVRSSGIADEQQDQAATLAAMARANTQILGLAIGGLVLGIALAWWIGRGIAAPVVRMCAAMRALAAATRPSPFPAWAARTRSARWPPPYRCSRTA